MFSSNNSPQQSTDDDDLIEGFTTDTDLVYPVFNGKVQEPCTTEELLVTLVNMDDEDRPTTWSVIK